MDEHRKSVRIDDSFKISYKVVSPPDGWGDTTSINISSEGIAIPINSTLLPGIILELEIVIADNTEPIKATGEIVWIKKRNSGGFQYTAGLKFVHIDSSSHDRIRRYINRRTGKKSQTNVKWLE